MPTFPIPALADVLFGNLPKDRGQGVEIYTDESKIRDRGAISLKVAPQDIQFAQRSRISEQVIKDGRAFFFWRKDRYSSHLDLLELRIGGITRSLARERTIPRTIGQVLGKEIADIGSLFIPSDTPTTAGGENQVTQKQRDWLRLWRITREGFVTENGINNHHIRLHTPALPSPIDFVGHFAGPIDWRHSAKNPFLVEWQLSLIVHRTNPDLEVLFTTADTVELVGTQ